MTNSEQQIEQLNGQDQAFEKIFGTTIDKISPNEIMDKILEAFDEIQKLKREAKPLQGKADVDWSKWDRKMTTAQNKFKETMQIAKSVVNENLSFIEKLKDTEINYVDREQMIGASSEATTVNNEERKIARGNITLKK